MNVNRYAIIGILILAVLMCGCCCCSSGYDGYDYDYDDDYYDDISFNSANQAETTGAKLTE